MKIKKLYKFIENQIKTLAKKLNVCYYIIANAFKINI